jgi:hypothetical protein
VSVPKQLTIEGEEDDGLTWQEWFLSLPLDPEDEQRRPEDAQHRIEEAA